MEGMELRILSPAALSVGAHNHCRYWDRMTQLAAKVRGNLSDYWGASSFSFLFIVWDILDSCQSLHMRLCEDSNLARPIGSHDESLQTLSPEAFIENEKSAIQGKWHS